MQWTDDAIILSYRHFSENSLIVNVFTIERGLHKGLIRGTKKHLSICQPGNHIRATWKARLEEQLGFLQIECKNNFSSLVLDDSLKLSALSSICSLINNTLPDRDPHPHLFQQLLIFLCDLTTQPTEKFLKNYVELELLILNNLGYGLDLNDCAAGGSRDDLFYVSPKSGRSVSKEYGQEYHNKLLKLPSFLKPQYGNNNPEKTHNMLEIIDGIKLTDYFLGKYIFNSLHHTAPAARSRFINKLQRLGNEKDAIKS